jgi:hypothetical protein
MQTTDKWNYYLDDDDCTCMDLFDSKEAALKAGMEEAKSGWAETITVGRVKEFVPDVRVFASFLIDNLQDQAYDDGGEYAETWLADVTDGDLKDLEDILDAAFTHWLDRHPEYKPNFYTLTNEGKFDKGGNPID